jgi:MIP family channel proteins
MGFFTWGIDRSDTGMAATGTERAKVVDLKAVMAEFVAMTLFVMIGCGTATGHGAFDGATRLLVAMAFGMGILVLAYSIGHHSGGQINCAVTFSLVLGGQVPWYQGLFNVIGQLFGSVLGACFLCIMVPCEKDMTTTLGTNIVNEDYGQGSALFAEIFGTFLLCYVVWETAVSPQATCGQNACIAIGFAVFLSHLVLLPIDGCSINPTRSFGPAIVSKIRGCDNYTEGGLDDLWVMWIGPLLGAALATAVQKAFLPKAPGLNEVVPANVK